MTDENLHGSADKPPPRRSPERHGERGKLRVFLGIGPGAGKTAAMLQAAVTELLVGRHVAVGVANRRGSRMVDALLARIPWVRHEAHAPEGEMDLDAVLQRRPNIAVVDELAHSNAAGARHMSRFQDVQELLESGIHVYTTLNIYELTSRAELPGRLPGIIGRQVIPDTILDNAVIDLVDLPPAELITRLRHGDIRLPEGRELVTAGFFEEANLMALREMSVRYFAERVAKVVQEFRQATNVRGPAHTSQRVLVAVESGWNIKGLILWTARLVGSLNASWVVLYVETARSAAMEEESGLTGNLTLARDLGAEVITTSDEDVAGAVLRVAMARNITQIVVGKSGPRPWWQPFRRDRLLADLIRGSGEIGVHVAPLGGGTQSKGSQRKLERPGWWQYAVAVGTVVAVGAAGFPFSLLVGAHAMAFLSLLAVVLLALFVERGPALVAAALSAAIWDYFFLPPVFKFEVSHFDDALLLGMYFVVALALGQLTARIRAQEAAERQRERRATALYLLTRELAEATSLDQIVSKVIEEMERAFDAEVIVLLAGEDGAQAASAPSSPALGERDREAAAWALEHLQSSGKFTMNMPMVDWHFMPLVSRSGPLGVLGLRLRRAAMLTIHQQNLLDALVRQIALSLDRQRLSELSGKATLLAESERLSKMLLDSMSHEIRTPLAAIESATSSLAELNHSTGPGADMIAEIREATERLNRLVGKVLDITRLETGRVEPSFTECDVGEVISFALAGTERELARHKMKVEVAEDLPMLRLDFTFLQEALMNLLSNAAHHTPAGTTVEVRVWTAKSTLFLAVADRGPGIPPGSLPRIFEKFYRGPSAPTGGTGLGLSLVKGFVEVLGGRVEAINRAGGGAEFTIRLPIKPIDAKQSVAI